MAGSDACQKVVVATDDERIAEAVREFGGHVVMTSEACPNGTVRCHEAVERLEAEGQTFDAVLNIQGDEPFVHPEQIEQLADMLRKPDAAVVTLAKSMPDDPEIHSPHRVKVVRNMKGRALMFSRSPIPQGDGPWLQHVGLYGFTRTALEALVQLSAPPRLNSASNSSSCVGSTTVGASTWAPPPTSRQRWTRRRIWWPLKRSLIQSGNLPVQGANSARIFAPSRDDVWAKFVEMNMRLLGATALAVWAFSLGCNTPLKT